MSGHGGSSASRQLTATEELEKLEQSITLTLQEIDQNFSRAHQIVTGSILPVVEQYGEHCKAVWDSSKFWKQFFEAAANVSLSGYEDLANEGSMGAEETTIATHDETSADYTAQLPDDNNGDEIRTYHGARDESLLTDDDGDLSGSTPRPPATKSLHPQFADMDSPYENLRREMGQGSRARGASGPRSRSRSGSRSRAAAMAAAAADAEDESTIMRFDDEGDGEGDAENPDDCDDSSAADSELLAQRTARLPNMSMTPRPSLDERDRYAREEAQAMARQQKDPLMHRVLGRDYRIQATPHKSAARSLSPMRLKVTERPPSEDKGKAVVPAPAWHDDSPMSSPEMAVPKLRSAAFMSPMRAAYRSKLAAAVSVPRTPGVSVQTPARRPPRDITFDDISTAEAAPKSEAAAAAVPSTGATLGKSRRDRDEITWESSDEDGEDLYGGMSPPKTISFALPPSKLLQTPAQEASKRIVEDILLTAGDDLEQSSEYSPTMVKMNADILDDTF